MTISRSPEERKARSTRPGAAPFGHPDRFLVATVEQLGEAALNLGACEEPQWRQRRKVITVKFARWLEKSPGEDWPARWTASGVEGLGAEWMSSAGLNPATARRAAATLMTLRVVRPSYGWMALTSPRGLTARFQEVNDIADFARLRDAADRLGVHRSAQVFANLSLVRMLVVTGKVMADITKDDFLAYAASVQALDRAPSLHIPWQLLRRIGFLAGEAQTWQETMAVGRSSVEEIVDRNQLQCREVRDLLVAYAKHRAPMLDYGSLWATCYYLANLFWGDIEKHNPGITSLHLEPAVIEAWKRRMQSRMAPISYFKVLVMVRAFYLDLGEWALAEPERWGPWTAACPVYAHEMKGHLKVARKNTARLHARIRTLAPLLPTLARSAREWMKEMETLIAGARAVGVGETFAVGDQSYVRLGNAYRPGPKVLVQEQFGAGRKIDLSWTEDDAFWAWAVIDVLRLTGVRVEELLELSHLGIRQYVRRDGQVTPLLQISPSKTDRERVIPMSPELVHVLARILRRIKGRGSVVPLVARYDTYERAFSEPLPFLFQRSLGQRLVVHGHAFVLKLLTRAAERAGIAEVDGQPVHFTPHDFRRIFATEIVNSGLPIHIGAKLLGHMDLNTTQRYVAVYPEEVIQHFEAYIARRRRERPSDEYREPTPEEWVEFEEHFLLRKVALGDCGRPYGTPCIHEHACVRCPFLRIDPSQLHRLVELEQNTSDRVREAEERGWLGEVAGLNESLIQIGRKKDQVLQLQQDEQLSLV